MIGAATLIVVLAMIAIARVRLRRSRQGVMDKIDGMRRQPMDLEDADREALTGAFTFFTTVRDTYFDKSRKVRTDEDRMRLAWLESSIDQLRSRHAELSPDPDPPA